MKIDLTFHLVSPYHSAPISGREMVVNDNGKITPKGLAGDGGASPLTATYKEPKYLSNIGESIDFPVIRSLQFCKQIRNALNADIINSLKDQSISIKKASTYAGMTVGAASGSPSGMSATLDQTVKAVEEPIALLGGGTFCLSSTLSVSDINLYHDLLVAESLVAIPPHIDQSKKCGIDPRYLTYPIPITRNDPISQINKPDQINELSIIDNYQDQIKEWQEHVEVSQTGRKADKAIKKKDLRNIVAFEAVIPGVIFCGQLELPKSAGLATKGALISIVSDFVTDGLTLGGRSSRGCGQFTVQASVDGKLLDISDYEEAIDSYSEWLTQVTPELLSEFYEA